MGIEPGMAHKDNEGLSCVSCWWSEVAEREGMWRGV